ncbi:endonuclease/exonuclease/phosphatase family protein [Halomarina halobia]|uniref:Endonuclease/exonuclease/phosphatase family protein n=1 Tax=Halomarina halobia TaxID=3033386 RepID=A0ABD6A7K3_9EURY|nr:endonuclease/exonuclease/phosphatase family protein [Halomarina sp. PSR21]
MSESGDGRDAERTVTDPATGAVKRRTFVVGTGAAALGLGATRPGGAARNSSNESHASEPDGEGTSIRVLNWNIHHGTGMDGVYDLRRIADLIVRSGADLVALQEVDKHLASRSRCDDQPRRLADRLGMHVDYAANITDYESSCEEQSRYGTAILTERKYPILDSAHYELPSPQVEEGAYNEPRGLQETTVEVEGETIRFYTTHLDHLFERRRAAQVEAILDATADVSDPQVITGDFNATPDSGPIEAMTGEYVDAFAAVGNGDSYTYPAVYTDSAPEKRIDYVFTSADGVAVEDAGISEETLVSDHLPTVADLRIRRSA